MKRKIALLMIFIFTLSLFSPVVQAWDRDWNSPRYSNSAYNQSTDMDPWGETRLTPPTIKHSLFEMNLVVLVLELFFDDFKYQPQVIIIMEKDSDDIVNENIIRDENHEKNANNKTSTKTPSGE